jgi:hypothetical protein
LFLFFVPRKLMAALAYRDDKILARNLLSHPFFCLTPAEPFFRLDRNSMRRRVERRSRMAAAFGGHREAARSVLDGREHGGIIPRVGRADEHGH